MDKEAKLYMLTNYIVYNGLSKIPDIEPASDTDPHLGATDCGQNTALITQATASATAPSTRH